MVSRRLDGVYETLLSRMKTTSEQASSEQDRAIALLAALVVIALVVGVLVAWWSQRMLSPLPRLQERVEAVARGDLERQQIGLHTDDEIGRLAREFERMKKLARERGQVIAIGHPHPTTLDLLERELPKLAEQGFELVAVTPYVGAAIIFLAVTIPATRYADYLLARQHRART